MSSQFIAKDEKLMNCRSSFLEKFTASSPVAVKVWDAIYLLWNGICECKPSFFKDLIPRVYSMVKWVIQINNRLLIRRYSELKYVYILQSLNFVQYIISWEAWIHMLFVIERTSKVPYRTLLCMFRFDQHLSKLNCSVNYFYLLPSWKIEDNAKQIHCYYTFCANLA